MMGQNEYLWSEGLKKAMVAYGRATNRKEFRYLKRKVKNMAIKRCVTVTNQDNVSFRTTHPYRNKSIRRDNTDEYTQHRV